MQRYCSSSMPPDAYNGVSPESLWEDLKPTVSYLPSKELELVHKALKMAFDAHDGQKRRNGEPFIIHPVEVARILGELELDWESIAAGLLHDTVEDTNVVTFERIEEEFGPVVRHRVEEEYPKHYIHVSQNSVCHLLCAECSDLGRAIFWSSTFWDNVCSCLLMVRHICSLGFCW